MHCYHWKAGCQMASFQQPTHPPEENNPITSAKRQTRNPRSIGPAYRLATRKEEIPPRGAAPRSL
jgi:hypothetical protein